jgi:predicted exporter
MIPRSFWLWLAASLLMLASLPVLLPRMHIESDLLAMLPDDQRDPVAEAANVRMTQNLSKRLLLLVGAEDIDHARSTAANIANRLRQSAAFADVQLEPNAAALRPSPEELGQRFLLLSEAHRASLRRAPEGAALQQAAMAALYSPTSIARTTRVADDPLGIYEQFLQSSLPLPGRASLESGVLTVRGQGKVWVLLLCTLAQSPFAYDQLGPLEQSIAEARQVAKAAGSVLYLSGVAPHAVKSAQRAKAEMSLLGTGSMIVTVLLLWTVFGALRPTALAVLSIGLGIAAGSLACALLFGRVHLMTLVFGSSLIGVAVDYALHFLSDQYRDPLHWQPRAALPHVGRGLSVGLITSVLGYIAFASAPMPVLRQMAAFSAAGLIAAYCCVRFGFPVLARRSPLAAGSRVWMRAALQLKPRRLHWSWWLLLFVATVGGLAQLKFSDDLRLLQNHDAKLLADEQQVRTLLGGLADRRYFLVTAADAETLLQREEALAARLEPLQQQGAISDWQALSRAIPSVLRQQENRSLLARLYAPDGAIAQQRALLGFEGAEISAQTAAFAAAEPLGLATALASPRLAAIAPLWLGELHGQQVSVVLPSGIVDDRRLASAAIGLAGVQFKDPVRDISASLGAQRQTALWRMVGAYLLAALCLTAVYGWRKLPQMMFPTVTAGLVTLAVLGWAGLPANLFHVLALLIALGMGLDYAIFLREGSGAPVSARMGVLAAALSTLACFGGLTLSATPFLRSIGLTLLLSIGLCLVLALLTAPLPHESD